jgi:hypothetical protein
MDISIVVPGQPVALPDPFAASLGGSETAGLQVAKALARRRRGSRMVPGMSG